MLAVERKRFEVGGLAYWPNLKPGNSDHAPIEKMKRQHGEGPFRIRMIGQLPDGLSSLAVSPTVLFLEQLDGTPLDAEFGINEVFLAAKEEIEQ